jgi:hypothetical protein
MTSTPHVYTAITNVAAALAKEGIAKDKKNEQQKYKFRGIDDVFNALSTVLAANKLCIIPVVEERDVVERKSNSGGALFYVTVRVRFDLVSAEDGSLHSARTYGEAMDSGDKATNKAMSAAYKYMAMQLFCIPTEGQEDADSETHQVEAKSPAAATTGTLANETQADALAGYLDSEGVTEPQRKRIQELLDLHLMGRLTRTQAANALNALSKPKN